MNLLKILRFFPNKYVRKYIGGYWEKWSFITFTKNDSMRQRHYWLNVTKKDANNIFYMPPGNAESVMLLKKVEYYPYNFFGDKKDFSEEIKIQHIREQKLKRILKVKR